MFLLVLKLCLYLRTECECIAQQERGNINVSPLYVGGKGRGGELFSVRGLSMPHNNDACMRTILFGREERGWVFLVFSLVG